MDKSKNRDLVINGSGSSGGGTFDRVKISGSGRVHGDLACEEFKTSGQSEVSGLVKADSFTVSGQVKIGGSLNSAYGKVSGQATVGGDIHCKELHIHGMVEAKGSFSGERLDMYGGLKTGGDCEAEQFMAHGGFEIGGLLNAGTIEIKLHAPCKVREIGGESIEVRKSGFGFKLKELFISLFMQGPLGLVTETIQGDDIHLEYTRADVVRGKRVTIGAGCEIGLVEYQDLYKADPNARVGESRQHDTRSSLQADDSSVVKKERPPQP